MAPSDDKPVGMEIEGDQNKEPAAAEGFLDKVKDFLHDIGDRLEEAAAAAVSHGKADAALSAVHFTSLDPHRAHLLLDVLVANNSSSAPLSLPGLRYLLDSNGRELASGTLPLHGVGAVAPHASEVLKLPLVLSYDDVRAAHPDIRPGSVIPYSVALEIGTAGEAAALRVEKAGELPVPEAPQVELRRVGLEKVSLEEVSATLHLRVGNANDFDLGVNAVECEVWLGGVSLGKEAVRASAVVVRRGGEVVVQVPVRFRPSELGSAAWEVVRGRAAAYAMKGSLEADTPFGAMRLPFGKDEGSTKLRKADDGDVSDDDEEEEAKK